MNYNSRPRYPPGIGNGRGSGGGGNYAHQNPNFQSRPPYHHQQQNHNQPQYVQKNSTQQNQYQNQHQQPQQQQQWMMRRPANFTDSNSSVATTQSTSTEVIQSPQSHFDSRYSLSRALCPNFRACCLFCNVFSFLIKVLLLSLLLCDVFSCRKREMMFLFGESTIGRTLKFACGLSQLILVFYMLHNT